MSNHARRNRRPPTRLSTDLPALPALSVALAAPRASDTDLIDFLEGTAAEAEANGYADVAPVFSEAAHRLEDYATRLALEELGRRP